MVKWASVYLRAFSPASLRASGWDTNASINNNISAFFENKKPLDLSLIILLYGKTSATITGMLNAAASKNRFMFSEVSLKTVFFVGIKTASRLALYSELK